ncbi:MAG: hypothetical protein QM526_00215 [Alphaproteobacteria bacterium]|nr:hypothetical protein [Alphaproteobacteria bacterium]
MPQSTQSFIPIKEIRDGIIVHDDGSLSAIVLVSAMNFDLKSADEQQATLYQFQSLINSLESSTQIIVQSRRVDLKEYLTYLQELYEKQTNDLLRLQTKEYIVFIKKFLETHDIMSKRFFVVLQYVPLSIKQGFTSLFTSTPSKNNDANAIEKSFEEAKTQLVQRISFVQSNVRSLGLRAVMLDTEEAIETFYQTFNPGDTQSPKQKISAE